MIHDLLEFLAFPPPLDGPHLVLGDLYYRCSREIMLNYILNRLKFPCVSKLVQHPLVNLYIIILLFTYINYLYLFIFPHFQFFCSLEHIYKFSHSSSFQKAEYRSRIILISFPNFY